jgi:mono/diheme cytochrome c family protein/glucose/arabinose dehydrogenase
MPLPRKRAPENVLMQSAPAFSRSCATRPLPALAMNNGCLAATLERSLSRTVLGGILGTINGKASSQLQTVRAGSQARGSRIVSRNHFLSPWVTTLKRGEAPKPLYHPPMTLLKRPSLPRTTLASLLLLPMATLLGAPQAGDTPGQPRPPPLPDGLAVPTAPALSPEEELATFELPEGLRIELVAAEPLLNDPVMATFDGQGRLWVVEMTGFMPNADGAGEQEPVGSIAVLDDDDGDGRMDRRTVFLDKLVLPRAVAPTRGGALVIAPPDVLFCRDTDDDGRADVIEVVDTGLGGIQSPEHAPNALLPTLDNTFACSKHTRRYRFTDGDWTSEAVPLAGQWGLTQDDEGRLLFNTNSDPLRAHLVDSAYSQRHPLHGNIAGVDVQLAADRSAWPSRMTTGVNRGYLPETLRDDWTLRNVTAACSPWVFRGDALRAEDRGAVFVCEPSGNLIQRYILEQDDSGKLSARNPHVGRDFLTSTDERFRPVNMMGGPDGALYVVDFYRGILQHRIFMTSWLRAQVLDRQLETPLGRGRIWRILNEEGTRSQQPALDTADSAGLLKALESTQGWRRDRAQQALVENYSGDAMLVASLREVSRSAQAPLTRLQALWTLSGLKALSADDVEHALRDKDARVRRAAVRLSEPFLGARSNLVAMLLTLDRAQNEQPSVRHQVLLSLGASPAETCTVALAEAITRDAATPERRSAVLSALAGRGPAFLTHLLNDPAWSHPGAGRELFLRLLARDIGRTQITENLEAVLQWAVNSNTRSDFREALLGGLLEAQPTNRLGKPGRLPLATRPTTWNALLESPGEQAARLAEVLTFPGHPTPDIRIDIQPLSETDRANFQAGHALYTAACARCHQPSGHGQPGLAPRIRNSPWVLGDPRRLIRILLHGLRGPILVDGSTWDLDMPALAGDDKQMAAVLTYIRREWGHGAEPITAQDVSAVRLATSSREEPWTAAELQSIGQP